ncbi:transcription factor jumonji [Tieghemostelium lacteum]|uniref:Transcription factor jumonji n=1 Tax=Tieghemostelium lacteum TaxID=361077 RepID=A0A151Z655_TIELA|nr:transcription factor jumonji [Tieghemostelium lacteum]|eukprot:KYQ89443.1 transcription factor jumonji [Tieghemostelium lacteum]
MTIEKIYQPSREIYEKYILENKPFIITGIVENWKCYQIWKPEYLLNKVGDSKIPVRELGYEVGEWLGKTTEISFKEFLESWIRERDNLSLNQPQLQQPKYYLASIPVYKYLKELENDYEVPEIPKEQDKSANLWVGSKGQVTHLHHDWSTGDPGMDGLHAIISGRKLFKLYDPELNIECFKRKSEWGLFHQALVDVENPDYEKYPEFRKAVGIDVVLEQGEMLFIPKLWWHYVRTLEHSISLNFWFQHMGSEYLKLTKHWGLVQEYIQTVYTMNISKERMHSLLLYFGSFNKSYPLTADIVQDYLSNPIKFISQPKFISSFSNAINNPNVKDKDLAQKFKKEIIEKVTEWVENKRLSLSNIQ